MTDTTDVKGLRRLAHRSDPHELFKHAKFVPAGPGFGPSSAGVPAAFYSTLGANLNLTVSAFDQAAFDGSVVLDAASIPEPTTAVLVGLGLLCAAGCRIRSRS